MRTVAPLTFLVLLLAVASPARAGDAPTVGVQQRPTGVDLAARTPGEPPGSTGAVGEEPTGSDPEQTRSVSCLYVPAASPSGGLTFAAQCSNPTATSINFDPFGNVRFMRPLPGPGGPPAQAPPGGQPTVSAATLAEQARRFLPLPAPIIRTNPTPDHDQLVNLPTWLWVAASSWNLRTATASVPGLSVTVTAVPVTVTWVTGDGGRVLCHGPGTPYDTARSPTSQATDCSHAYRQGSAGQPGGRYLLSATTTWQITWAASGAVTASGALPPLARTAQTTLRVAEAQALN